ncbi:MAG: hypothetical protein J5898_11180 [Lachnospiraceae bacterium]|nr:hypothetical protein [Lachnospiraceae bacterium]
MSREELRKTLLDIFEEMGIILDEEGDFDIQDYISDSSIYMSFIVSMEQRLGIEIPDEFLMLSKMGSFYEYCDSLLLLMNEEK